MSKRASQPLAAALVAAMAACISATAQTDTANGEWPHYAGDQSSSKYSPLNQINKETVNDLVEVWRWESVSTRIAAGNRRLSPGQFKNTPLMVGGVLYVSTGLSQIAALDAASGDTLWIYDPESYKLTRPTNTGFQHRGVEYWKDGGDERIVIATGGRQLAVINAKTGKPYPDFGDDGIVDLTKGLGREINPGNYGFNAPPIVVGDTIVLGSIVSDGPNTKKMPPGHVRGFDIRTGEQKWIFHTIPQPGELGNETWPDGSWEYIGNTNVWAWMSADPELGYVYMASGTPTNDWYGGHRAGENLFAETIICLNAATGERVWHFQAIHHGLWDYDFPCAPNLVDITVDGKAIKALAQVSKQGFTYVFDRITGEPVWPIEDRPVPQTSVPGEWTAATQPHPTKPPAFERQGFGLDDLIDFTPELRAEAEKILDNYTIGPLYTPPTVVGANGKLGTLMLPSAAGGANWGGAAADPETGILYVASMTLAMINGVSPGDSNRTEFDYVRAGGFLPTGPQGLPMVKPPYGRITAIDLNKGEIVWQVPHGQGPTEHPAIKHLNLGPLGAAANGVLSNGGGMLTKELFFMIQSDVDESTIMRMGSRGYIRAYDKTNGDLVWERRVDSTPHGSPMTYMHNGKQYIVHAVGGARQTPELVAYALP